MSNFIKIEITTGIEQDCNGNIIPEETANEALLQCRRYLATTFGGVTVTHTVGDWMNNGNLVSEEGRTFTALIDSEKVGPAEIKAAAIYVRCALCQNCVALTVTAVQSFELV